MLFVLRVLLGVCMGIVFVRIHLDFEYLQLITLNGLFVVHELMTSDLLMLE